MIHIIKNNCCDWVINHNISKNETRILGFFIGVNQCGIFWHITMVTSGNTNHVLSTTFDMLFLKLWCHCWPQSRLLRPHVVEDGLKLARCLCILADDRVICTWSILQWNVFRIHVIWRMIERMNEWWVSDILQKVVIRRSLTKLTCKCMVILVFKICKAIPIIIR